LPGFGQVIGDWIRPGGYGVRGRGQPGADPYCESDAGAL